MEGPLLLRCTALTCYTNFAILGLVSPHEATRVHHASWRRSRVAALVARAAASDAGGGVSQQRVVALCVCRRALTPGMRAFLHLSLSRSGRRGQRHQRKGCGYV